MHCSHASCCIVFGIRIRTAMKSFFFPNFSFVRFHLILIAHFHCNFSAVGPTDKETNVIFIFFSFFSLSPNLWTGNDIARDDMNFGFFSVLISSLNSSCVQHWQNWFRSVRPFYCYHKNTICNMKFIRFLL